MIAFNKKERVVFLKTVRQTIYFALTFLFVFFLHFLADIYKVNTFDEHSIAENIQLTFLLLSGIIFITESVFYKKYRTVLLLLASLSFFASCRELDKFFDTHINIIGWKFAFIFPISAIFNAFIHKKNLRNTLINFYASPAFYMMCCAMIIILPIAQCIGHGPFVRDVMGDYRVGDVKELFEEACETIGYFLILLSSVETYLGLLKKEN